MCQYKNSLQLESFVLTLLVAPLSYIYIIGKKKKKKGTLALAILVTGLAVGYGSCTKSRQLGLCCDPDGCVQTPVSSEGPQSEPCAGAMCSASADCAEGAVGERCSDVRGYFDRSGMPDTQYTCSAKDTLGCNCSVG